MNKEIEKLRNLGPQTARWLEDIGITSKTQLAATDPVDIYVKLKLKGFPVTKNILTGIVGALQNKDWRQVDDATRRDLYEKVDLIDKSMNV